MCPSVDVCLSVWMHLCACMYVKGVSSPLVASIGACLCVCVCVCVHACVFVNYVSSSKMPH